METELSRHLLYEEQEGPHDHGGALDERADEAPQSMHDWCHSERLRGCASSQCAGPRVHVDGLLAQRTRCRQLRQSRRAALLTRRLYTATAPLRRILRLLVRECRPRALALRASKSLVRCSKCTAVEEGRQRRQGDGNILHADMSAHRLCVREHA